jgi:hypothetical protein
MMMMMRLFVLSEKRVGVVSQETAPNPSQPVPDAQ